MIKWAVKNDTKDVVLREFDTIEEGIDYAFQLIAENFSNIENIVDSTIQLLSKNIEENSNNIYECDDYYDIEEGELLKKQYDLCKEAIEQFRDFSRFRSSKIIELIEHHDAECESDQCMEEDGIFHVETNSGILCADLVHKFRIETNVFEQDAEYIFVFVKIETNGKVYRVRLSINKVFSPPSIANIYLVYNTLEHAIVPLLREEIKKTIFSKYRNDESGWEKSLSNVTISDDTITNQIHALQNLGIPIHMKRLSRYDKKKAKNDKEFARKNREGFYIDWNNPITPDYSKCTPRGYIMLVYLVLKDTEREHTLPTQKAIVDAVQNRFGIKLRRQRVKQYIDILTKLDVNIEHDEAGYWMLK